MTAMTAFASALRELRQHGRYPRTADLATRAGVTQRVLEFYEAGKKLPKAKTLDALLQIAGATSEEAARLRRLRDEAHAEREGLGPHHRGIEDRVGLVERLVTDVALTLRQRGIAVPGDVLTALRARIDSVVHTAMRSGQADGTPNDNRPRTTGFAGSGEA